MILSPKDFTDFHPPFFVMGKQNDELVDGAWCAIVQQTQMLGHDFLKWGTPGKGMHKNSHFVALTSAYFLDTWRTHGCKDLAVPWSPARPGPKLANKWRLDRTTTSFWHRGFQDKIWIVPFTSLKPSNAIRHVKKLPLAIFPSREVVLSREWKWNYNQSLFILDEVGSP